MSVRVGTSGWSYRSWQPGFYPQGTTPEAFLAFYARSFDSVELNTTGYRLPTRDQFRRWADAVPDGFRFAPKLALRRFDRLGPFLERVRGLGDRLGPVRVVVEGPRDERWLEDVLDAVGPGAELAFDFRDRSWAGVGAVVRVGDTHAEPYRYIRMREPPYSDEDLRALAGELRAPAYVFFRHEDEPTAPAYARRLRELLAAGSPA